MSPATREARRAYARAYMQQRRARGVCARCGEALPPNYRGWRHYDCKRREYDSVKQSTDPVVS